MKRRKNRSRDQKELRRRRDEHVFLFDREFCRCIGRADLDAWELAISICGGSVAQAALQCGIADVPRDAKALWGRSADEALRT